MIRYIRDLRAHSDRADRERLPADAESRRYRSCTVRRLFASNSAPPADGDVSVIAPDAGRTAPTDQSSSWAQQMFNFPDGSGAAAAPATWRRSRLRRKSPKRLCRHHRLGRRPSRRTASKTAEKAPRTPAAGTVAPGKDAKPTPTATERHGDPDRRQAALPTGAERAILERLQQRREELDNRAHELDIRESLIQKREKRMDAKLAEIKQVRPRSSYRRKRRTKPRKPGSKVLSPCTRT